MKTKYILEYLNKKDIWNISLYAPNGVNFFLKHPEAIPIFLNHYQEPLFVLYRELLNNRILNSKGKPYNQSVLSKTRLFFKDLIVFINSKANNENHINIKK